MRGVHVAPFGEVTDADPALDAVLLSTDAITRETRATGIAGVAGPDGHLAGVRPVVLYGWVLAGRVYAAPATMPAQTMLLYDREDRNTLVAIYARDRNRYDPERFVRIDSATSRYNQIGGQDLLPGLPLDVTERIYHGY